MCNVRQRHARDDTHERAARARQRHAQDDTREKTARARYRDARGRVSSSQVDDHTIGILVEHPVARAVERVEELGGRAAVLGAGLRLDSLRRRSLLLVAAALPREDASAADSGGWVKSGCGELLLSRAGCVACDASCVCSLVVGPSLGV